MENINPHIDDLIIQLLCGELDETSLAELRAWIADSPENEKYFHDRQEIWFSSVDNKALEKYDKKAAYQEFLQRVHQAELHNQHTQRTLWKRWMSYAAAVAAAVVLTFTAYYYGKDEVVSGLANITVEAPDGSRTKTLLPDGTVVWLNAGSRLTYSQAFGLKERQIELEGEGYFEVRKNASLPFSVNSGNLKVTVLGTKFNFRDYPDEPEAEVALEEGSVQLDNLMKANETKLLSPGKHATLNKQTGNMVLATCDTETVKQWINGMLIFNGDKISTIVNRIEHCYNVKVTVDNDSLEDYRFYGDFIRQEHSLTEVLDALSATGKIHYRMSGRDVIIH